MLVVLSPEALAQVFPFLVLAAWLALQIDGVIAVLLRRIRVYLRRRRG